MRPNSSSPSSMKEGCRRRRRCGICCDSWNRSESPRVRIDGHCQSILDRFIDDRALYALPVIDASFKPVALVYRKHYIEFFTKPYSREIFGRRSILELLAHEGYESSESIIVEDSCSVEDVAQIIIDAGMQHMVTGFLVSSQGRYLGVANGHDLLNIISQRK